jgi:hypothetical protein
VAVINEINEALDEIHVQLTDDLFPEDPPDENRE